jgi:hypothetical protein
MDTPTNPTFVADSIRGRKAVRPRQCAWLRSLLAIAVLATIGLLGPRGVWAFTLTVENPVGDRVTAYRWLLALDTTIVRVPGAPVNDSISLDIHNSYTPLVDKGVTTDTATVAIAVPDTERYFVSVLPADGHAMGGTSVLVGESAVKFEPQELDLGEDRCAVFQDIIKAGTMTDGGFEYKVQVMRDEEELASATREFLVAADATSGPSGP